MVTITIPAGQMDRKTQEALGRAIAADNPGATVDVPLQSQVHGMTAQEIAQNFATVVYDKGELPKIEPVTVTRDGTLEIFRQTVDSILTPAGIGPAGVWYLFVSERAGYLQNYDEKKVVIGDEAPGGVDENWSRWGHTSTPLGNVLALKRAGEDAKKRARLMTRCPLCETELHEEKLKIAIKRFLIAQESKDEK